MSQRKTVCSLSSTGVGKSALGNRVTGTNNFTVSDDPNSETKETVAKDGTFLDLLIRYIDTPGLNDSDGMDSQHVSKMVDYLKQQAVIHGILIGLNFQEPRLSSSLRCMLKLFCYIFKGPQFSQSVCFVFTHSFRANEQTKRQKQEQVSRIFKSIMTETGMNVQNQAIPSFFVDSTSDSEPTQQEFRRLKEWIANLRPLRTDLLHHADPQFEKIEEEKREIVVRTESKPIMKTIKRSYTIKVPRERWDGDLGKIFRWKKTVNEDETRYADEQVQVGTTTTRYYQEQKRYKKTTYTGQVQYTDWETIRSWTVNT